MNDHTSKSGINAAHSVGWIVRQSLRIGFEVFVIGFCLYLLGFVVMGPHR